MRVSIVLPAYNESANIPNLIGDVASAMATLGWQYEIIVVDDGSRDGTEQVAWGAGETLPLRVVRHTTNRGYGAALKSGFGAAAYEWVFFMDADRQFNIAEIANLARHTNTADAIIGYRAHRNDHIGRVFNAWLFRLAVRILFGLRVRDIDCAFKLIRRDVIQACHLESNGALINAEMLIRLRAMRARIIEVPVTHLPRVAGTPTGARLSVILKAMRDILLLRLTGHIARS
jgi:glycosyltransferase involved in cell wall biosynthesis